MTVSVFYFGIHDLEFTRNRRIREYLDGLDDVELLVKPRVASRSGVRGRIAEIVELVRGARAADVVVLSEFSLKYAPIVSVVARAFGARAVIDGVVGTYETNVEDWKRVAPRSLAALRFRLIDRLSFLVADLYLTDTEYRADALRRRYGTSTRVLSLPLGSPSWARPQPRRDPDGRLELLYYGNYIPLHGVDTVIDALDLLDRDLSVRVTMVGDGEARPAVESRVRDEGLEDVVRFHEPVSELDLARIIGTHDVVLGVFGTSPKAAGVIANKVWQGLSAGRIVLTQETPALDEVRELAGESLVTVPAGDADALAAAITGMVRVQGAESEVDGVAVDIDDYVAERFIEFGRFIGSGDPTVIGPHAARH